MARQDNKFINEPSHHVAMTVRSVICGIADLNEIDPDEIDTTDAADLLMAQNVLGRIVNSILQKKAA